MRWILHVDLDQFLAAAEKRRRPELAELPVIVGGSGDPSRARQVVACASYEARARGVRAGMPLRRAVRACPEATFLPSDASYYETVSAEVMTTLRELGDPVQVWGWDEAFVGTDGDPGQLADRIRTVVAAKTGLACAVGIGDNKLRAKLGTGFAKQSPERVFALTADNWHELMAELPTERLWGVGRKTAGKLADLGVRTVGQLAESDPQRLAEIFGPGTGPWLSSLGRGDGDTDVSEQPRVAKGRSRCTTYPEDLTERTEIDAAVAALAEQVGREVVAAGRTVVRVAVTVRTGSFFTRTKIMKLPEPSVDVSVVRAGALQVLDRFELDRPVRLLGVRVELADP